MAVAALFHDDAVAAVVVLDAVHEVPHQQHAAPARGLDVVFVGRVGDLGGIEAVPLVDDLDLEAIVRQAKAGAHHLVWIQPVAVADGVDQRLFNGQVDAEDFVLAPLRAASAVNNCSTTDLPASYVLGTLRSADQSQVAAEPSRSDCDMMPQSVEPAASLTCNPPIALACNPLIALTCNSPTI